VMLQQLMGKGCRLIVQVRRLVRPPSSSDVEVIRQVALRAEAAEQGTLQDKYETKVQAFMWRDDLPQNVGYKEITWDGEKILAAVPVTEPDRTILDRIAASPAVRVPLVPGTRPQEFRFDDQYAAAYA
jgi:hypothetical protein